MGIGSLENSFLPDFVLNPDYEKLAALRLEAMEKLRIERIGKIRIESTRKNEAEKMEMNSSEKTQKPLETSKSIEVPLETTKPIEMLLETTKPIQKSTSKIPPQAPLKYLQLQLSMGMTNDWRKAVALHSDYIRLGRAIFGEPHSEQEAEAELKRNFTQ